MDVKGVRKGSNCVAGVVVTQFSRETNNLNVASRTKLLEIDFGFSRGIVENDEMLLLKLQ